MEFLSNITQSFHFISIIKIILGLILSGIIGLERESLNKPAGFRTHSLVGVSAVIVMICGEYIARDSNTDITRIPAQLLSGIGFIGAGTILRDGFDVKGLTTAASLLCVTCIGLTVGAGYYLVAIIVTILAYLILKYSHKVSDNLVSLNVINLNLCAKDMKVVIPKIRDILTKYEVNIKQIRYDEKESSNIEKYRELSVIGRYKDGIDINNIISDIAALDEVSRVIQNGKEE